MFFMEPTSDVPLWICSSAPYSGFHEEITAAAHSRATAATKQTLAQQPHSPVKRKTVLSREQPAIPRSLQTSPRRSVAPSSRVKQSSVSIAALLGKSHTDPSPASSPAAPRHLSQTQDTHSGYSEGGSLTPERRTPSVCTSPFQLQVPTCTFHRILIGSEAHSSF
jgi:hypothetical protein